MVKKQVVQMLPEGDDWHTRLNMGTVEQAIEFLSEFPKDALIRVKSEGYDDVESYLYTYREETDEEYGKRLLREKFLEERKEAQRKLVESRKEVSARIKALQDELKTLGGKV